MPYDVSLGGVDFVTLNPDFVETVGSEYELVGRAVMPGPPRPLGFYNMSIPIHAAQEDGADSKTVADDARDEIRSLLQNDPVRAAGLDFTFTFDSSIEGWLVIGTADIAYAEGGPSIGDYVLRLGNAAHVGAEQDLLMAFRTLAFDRREATTPIDHLQRVHKLGKTSALAMTRHYLPVGAYDVVGQVDPVIPEVGTYRTIFGDGFVLEGRQHNELVIFDYAWDDLHKGEVRIYDRRGNLEPSFDADGDRDPHRYGWRRAFGKTFRLKSAEMPVLDNGRCRVRHEEGSTFVVDTVGEDGYELATSRFSLGYKEFAYASIESWTADRAVIKGTFRGDSARAAAYITLQRGWEGPAVDLYTFGDQRGRRLTAPDNAVVEERDGWRHMRVGAEHDEFQIDARTVRYLVPR